jgi:hypothetical protein
MTGLLLLAVVVAIPAYPLSGGAVLAWLQCFPKLNSEAMYLSRRQTRFAAFTAKQS